jgi:hypothetical protein
MVTKTGLSIDEHQRRTVDNFLELLSLAPELPIIPVLQGWEITDYYRCRKMYAAAGVDLVTASRVGLGSVCRRQHTQAVALMVRDMAEDGIRLHGLGIKKEGLALCAGSLMSSDSLAWSFGARMRGIRLPGCAHRTCANCSRYAMQWRDELISSFALEAA